MIQLFLLKYWKQILAILAVLVILLSIYNYGRLEGEKSATEQYRKEVADYIQKVDDRILKIQDTTDKILLVSKSKSSVTKQEIEKILADQIDYTKLVTIENNTCKLSKNVQVHYDKIIEEANK